MNQEQRNKIEPIQTECEIRICPVCGYKDGFHVSFLLPDDSGEREIVLICPRCHRRFQIGWKARLEG